jgi:hypothetical protein
MTTWVGGESEYEWSYKDVGRGLLELLRVLIQRDASVMKVTYPLSVFYSHTSNSLIAHGHNHTDMKDFLFI